jgi:hypothetical protein
MSKSKIIFNKLKIIETVANNELVNIVTIVLIINDFIERRTSTTSASLNQIAFVFDTVIKHKATGKTSVKLSSPWSAPYKYRELIIMACEKDFIKIVNKNSDVVLELGNEGIELISQITSNDLFLKLRKNIKKSVTNFKNVDFNLQNLIW